MSPLPWGEGRHGGPLARVSPKPTIKVGDRVHHVDATALGTVIKFVGRRGVGGGLHARVAWDTPCTSVVRLDLLVKVSAAEAERLRWESLTDDEKRHESNAWWL